MPVTPVVLYQDEDGGVPVRLWLDRIHDRRAIAKLFAKIERLRELGHELRRPEADYLRNDIYELRVRFQKVNYRLLYFFHGSPQEGTSQAVICHGCTKEGKVPREDIDRAVAARAKFHKDPNRHTHRE